MNGRRRSPPAPVLLPRRPVRARTCCARAPRALSVCAQRPRAACGPSRVAHAPPRMRHRALTPQRARAPLPHPPPPPRAPPATRRRNACAFSARTQEARTEPPPPKRFIFKGNTVPLKHINIGGRTANFCKAQSTTPSQWLVARPHSSCSPAWRWPPLSGRPRHAALVWLRRTRPRCEPRAPPRSPAENPKHRVPRAARVHRCALVQSAPTLHRRQARAARCIVCSRRFLPAPCDGRSARRGRCEPGVGAVILFCVRFFAHSAAA